MSSPKYPKDERICVGYYSVDNELLFILTSKKPSNGYFYLYELDGGSFKKLGKAHSPKELEDKFDVEKKMRAVR